jgi:hypothetical protein
MRQRIRRAGMCDQLAFSNVIMVLFAGCNGCFLSGPALFRETWRVPVARSSDKLKRYRSAKRVGYERRI